MAEKKSCRRAHHKRLQVTPRPMTSYAREACRFGLRLPDDLHQRVTCEAEARYTSKTAVMLQAIDRGLTLMERER